MISKPLIVTVLCSLSLLRVLLCRNESISGGGSATNNIGGDALRTRKATVTYSDEDASDIWDYARQEFGNYSDRVVFPELYTANDQVEKFMKETEIGQKYSLNQHIPRRDSLFYRYFVKDQSGFHGVKPKCASKQPQSNNNNRTTLFYLLTSADDYYLYQLQLSICTARESNPNLPITVGIAPAYLNDAHELSGLMKFLLNDVKVDSIFCLPLLTYGGGRLGLWGRDFSRNWLRLRLWELEDYFDTILYVDADTIIRKDLTQLLSLNVDFAAALDMDQTNEHLFTSFGSIQAGVLLIQPCRQVFLQMRAILEHNNIHPFVITSAEQSFLDWYYRYDGFRLPIEYNFVAHCGPGWTRNPKRISDVDPSIVHYTRYKITRDAGLSENMQYLAATCHERTKPIVPPIE